MNPTREMLKRPTLLIAAAALLFFGTAWFFDRSPRCPVWYVWVSECAQHRPYKDCALDYPLVEQSCNGWELPTQAGSQK